MIKTIITVLLILCIAVPALYFVLGAKSGKRLKKALLSNIISFFTTLFAGTAVMFSGGAAAANEAAPIADSVKSMAYISAAGVTGLACIGAGIAVAAAASAALGAISENETIMGKALIFVALAEGIALYGLLVSFTILGQVM